MPVTCTTVPINADCIGDRWEVNDEDQLAELVAMIAKCEFGHAQSILSGITPAIAGYTPEMIAEIKQDAIRALTLKTDAHGKELRNAAKWHRDGFLFEAISWIVARNSSSPDVLMRDPHIGATTQGLDGLMIELNPAHDDVVKTTIMEDKCVEDPQHTFRYETIPALVLYHTKHRKVLEGAASLLRNAFPASSINAIAAKAIRPEIRNYRASLTIENPADNQAGRIAIFDYYDRLVNLLQENRIACTFVPGIDVREWFEEFAKKVISKL